MSVKHKVHALLKSNKPSFLLPCHPKVVGTLVPMFQELQLWPWCNCFMEWICVPADVPKGVIEGLHEQRNATTYHRDSFRSRVICGALKKGRWSLYIRAGGHQLE